MSRRDGSTGGWFFCALSAACVASPFMGGAALLSLPAAVVFGALGAVMLTPEWREGVGELIGRTTELHWGKNKRLGAHVPGGTGRAEKPLPPPDADAAAQIAVFEASDRAIQLDRDQVILEFVSTASVDAIHQVIARNDQNGRADYARQMSARAIEKHPQSAKLLVIAGYIRAQDGDDAGALQAYRRAAEVSGPDDEYHFVALSNLAYRLAVIGDPGTRQEALEAGLTAHENHERFENRDSFSINYIFAETRFVHELEEFGPIFETILDVQRRPWLTDKEKTEVNEILGILVGKYNRLLEARKPPGEIERGAE